MVNSQKFSSMDFSSVVPLEQWHNYQSKPFVIAGPCSAETEEQVITTARQLSLSGNVSVFRAGLWKPRSRPGTFEGVGKVGLPWLQRVQREFGMQVATEVAKPKHILEAQEHGIDFVWIGARSTSSPFVVQEIADALRGTDLGVLVKNPINPDLELWIGAVERIVEAGINKVAAVHRGFSYYEKARYRNLPHWQIAIEFKQRLPEVPIFCDPSHISGNASIVAEVSQKAMDLKYDGLMVETHHTPSEAWSDAGQQITPNQLVKLLENLVVRNTVSDDQSFLSILSELRNKIDEIDDQILEVLEKRMAISETIARHKKTSKVTILQPSRWSEILQRSIAKGTKMGLDAEFVEAIFKAIHNESITHQSRVMNDERDG